MILFVDDDPNLLAGLWRNLSMTYEMDTAISGEDALELIKRKGSYAVIVSDINMPKMNGVEFLTQAHALSPNSVKIALSGWAGKEHVIDAVNNAHIFRFLTKPVPLSQMREVLDEAIERFLSGQNVEHVTADAFVKLSRSLNKAIEDEELFPVFQPQVDLDTGRLYGAETLVRWHHPLHGLVMPSAFIATAELTGAIVDLTKWLIERASQMAVEVNAAHGPFTVSVNISPAHLDRLSLVKTTAEVLEKTGLPAQCLEFELTETVLVENLASMSEILKQLSNMGVRIALDDFGSGYMNFSYLRELHVDKLKIDGSYVQHVLSDEKCAAIVQSMVSVGRSLGMTVVAERVENEAQAAFLRRIGCTLGQGFLFAEPMERDDWDTWLTSQKDGHSHGSVREEGK